MTLDQGVRDYLAGADLRGLFLGLLGWDQPGVAAFTVLVDDDEYEVKPVAQKRGLHVLQVPALPNADVQHKIDVEVSQRAPERLLVFADADRQVWRWPEPRKSGGVRLVPQESPAREPLPALVQRLAGVVFTLADEDGLTLPQVKDRVRAQFNAERVTERFYKRFESNHSELQDGIEGLDDEDLRRWYASLLMNRLMFIYFLQKKGFLSDDRDYLRTRLNAIRRVRGPDEFYAFYRDLLLPLFHHGFGSHTHDYADPAIAGLVGDVPYVNGGIFEEHELEADYEIRVPDGEFERIFDFFDSFTWHLDDRPHGDPNAINPDVIGYIFERYINLTAAGQKEEGAYYTKEDVTGYMVATTLVPRLIDRIVACCEINPFVFLQAHPVRYIPEAMRHGRELTGEWMPAPIDATETWKDVSSWGTLAEVSHDPELQLPGESWVETFDRRQHTNELLTAIANGEISSIDALVTRNLDARTLLADVIHHLDSPGDVAAIWRELTATTVIDPTCGSGAFLFAALDVLDEVYAALLERARTHLATGTEDAHEHLADLVADADKHPNDAYFRRKHAALSNLFGLDIMREAIETAKLRLFLALASKLRARSEIEPLPDLDFNLRAGNLLVGFKDLDDARERTGTTNLTAAAGVEAFAPKALEAARLRRAFLAAQAADDPDAVLSAKQALTSAVDKVRHDADYVLAEAVGVETGTGDFEEWWDTTQPFHWFLEFPHIVAAGGFDVVVGNPPYVNRRNVPYAIEGFAADGLPDIFAACVERALSLLNVGGRFAMILPISFQFSDDFKVARATLLARDNATWLSTYSRNPSALFTAGLGVRNTIVATSPHPGPVYTTPTRRWQEAARNTLFQTNRYAALRDADTRTTTWIPRTGDDELAELLHTLSMSPNVLGDSVQRTGGYPLGFKTTALYYLPVYIDVPPVYDAALRKVAPPNDSTIRFDTEENRLLAFGLLAGDLGLVWWMSTGDDFHVTATTLKTFPVGIADIEPVRDELLVKAEELRVASTLDENVLFTPYAGRRQGSWDLRQVRDLTREIDDLVLSTIDQHAAWPAINRALARFAKSTGERPGTERGTGWLEAARAAL